MNDLQKELQELKAKVADLESRIVAEPVKWQPKGGEWFINQCNDTVEYWKMNVEATKVAGLERQTEEQAKRAAVEMRRFNRLLALRDELCGDTPIDWDNSEGEKYRLSFDHAFSKWGWDSFCILESITPHFPTKKLAQKACDMLNSGEVTL